MKTPTRVQLTPEQDKKLKIARVAFMNVCPFYSQLYYTLGEEVITRDIPTLATDGKHIFVNPDYFSKLKTGEQVFALIHEMAHLVGNHPARFKHYKSVGKVRNKQFNLMFANVCADYVINAGIVADYGKDVTLNPDWLYDPAVKPGELWEDVYERTWRDPPCPPVPPPGGNNPGQQGQGSQNRNQSQPDPKDATGGQDTKTFKFSGRAVKGAKGDAQAQARGGRFDEILDPPVDPATGQPELPDEHEYREAISRAAATAKMMGKLPASIEQLVEEILKPEVDWREHIRMLLTGKIGFRGETWSRPNRRRLVLNPIVIMPSKKPYGCEHVVVALDSSGSIYANRKLLDAFMSEIGGIVNDCRPKNVTVIVCDAKIQQVETLASLDEFEGFRTRPVRGGGGTSFRPVFEYVQRERLAPEALVYLTDGYGSWPVEKPAYPVIWAMNTDVTAPFGDVVRLKVQES